MSATATTSSVQSASCSASADTRDSCDAQNVHGVRSAHASSHVSPKMQRDFDEALLRARMHPGVEDEEIGSSGAQLSDQTAPAPLPWAQKLPSTLSQAPLSGLQTFRGEVTAVSAGEAMTGAGAPVVATQQQAITAQSITPSSPALLQQHQGAVQLQSMAINGQGQQWQLQLPVAGATSGALGLRLTQSGTGEWQVRLHASASLRQQLQPHIGRLRQQLSQRGGRLEEDLGSEEEA
nr:hypothetical protein [uncultured Ottowia sp.]